MKKFLLLIFICSTALSCGNLDTSNLNVETIIFYDSTGEKIDLSQIKTQWYDMINESIAPEQRSLGELEIREFTDETSMEKSYALIAINSTQQVQTASIITKYKDGYQLSDRSASCYDCGAGLQIQLKEGYWYCMDNGNSSSPCTKTSRLDY